MTELVLRRLQQIKVLADPLRLRIFEALIETARTPKQVADLLGRKPTGLYHHVRALESAGLVRQTESRKKRGTVERYYRAVAERVRVHPAVFAGRRPAAPAVLTAVLRAADAEVRSLPSRGKHPTLALRIRARVCPSRVRELERVLQAWAASEAAGDSVEYSVTLLAYPRLGRRRRS